MADEKEIKSKGFMLYIEDEEIFRELTGDEAKAVLMACFAFHDRGEDQSDKLNGFARRAFILLKRNIVRDMDKYIKGQLKRKEGYERYLEEKRNTPSTAPLDVLNTPLTAQTKTQSKSKTETEARAEVQTEARARTKNNKGFEGPPSEDRRTSQPNVEYPNGMRTEYVDDTSWIKD